jgi:hypothetical protein
MSRLYLVTFEGSVTTRDALFSFLDGTDEILDWHSSMGNAVFVVTEVEASELRDMLREGALSRFIVCELRPGDIGYRVAGLLPRATWQFIRRKQHAE